MAEHRPPDDDPASLLPCPFCGTDPVMRETPVTGAANGWLVICDNVRCQTDVRVLGHAPEHSIRCWNTRA